ncbi:hypothetical protein GCM10023224_38010 [Streptomonospora halophila]|uniref:Uncharacterized protein n=1 Tax=Streptomonospora halophila TaxID=427369 RepID=A0ABP9GU22_9ACTN
MSILVRFLPTSLRLMRRAQGLRAVLRHAADMPAAPAPALPARPAAAPWRSRAARIRPYAPDTVPADAAGGVR